MPERREPPGVEVGLGQGSPGVGRGPGVDHVLAIGLDAVDAGIGEEVIEVVVEGLDVFLGNEGHLAVGRAFVDVGGIPGDLNGFVAFCKRTRGCEPGPITAKGMPDGNVLDVLVLGTDIGYEGFEAPREGLGFSLKVVPAVLPLAITSIVNVLPVVVDNQVGDADFVFGQRAQRLQNPVLRQSLAEGVPSA